jgi:CRP-like cAMP-binding protein
MPSSSPAPRLSENRLLSRLHAAGVRGLEASLEPVTLAAKKVLYDLNGPVETVFFPTTAMISEVILMSNGREVEAATIGNEGFVGVTVLFGLDFSPNHAVCQAPGKGFRMPTKVFLSAVDRYPEVRRVIDRYLAFSYRYANQTVACNALHPVEQRAARWLLMTSDRVGRDEFQLTQEFLAEMLGVHRPTVSVVASALQTAGLITYRRGVIRITDRPKLQQAACECYSTLREFYARVLG